MKERWRWSKCGTLKILFHKLYQSRFNQSTLQVKQDMINKATIPGTINATTLGAIALTIGVNTDTSNQLINV